MSRVHRFHAPLQVAVLIAVLALGAAPAFAQVELFGSPPEFELFEDRPMCATFFAPAKPEFDLFPSAQTCTGNSCKPAHLRPDELPIDATFAQVGTSLSKPGMRDLEDLRPIVDAYAVEKHIRSYMAEEAIGPGDNRVRVRWHHDAQGKSFPWHVHEYGKKAEYPVFHYRTAGGDWKVTSGMKTIDDLVQAVGADSKIASK